MIRAPNLRPQAAERNDEAQAHTQATASQHRDTAISRTREANKAPSQDNTSSATAKSQDGGKKKGDKKKSDKKNKKNDKNKKKTKKKNKKSKQNHKKPK
ncbi:hypothetical protein BN970_00298 [Mycolicibacterium conceptionense]|uniref:Uncharacterized protein n=1 Tax=Mycolicibacterium conceptionense TaxID=451644 RepID=A0A0U1CVU1_9MYCO|nr:hypothetical protein [Mycolicibacterium conceptionense]CQD02888.1 hypothetical protein BN970_00298 [Mycolicibacterium conceptionense]